MEATAERTETETAQPTSSHPLSCSAISVRPRQRPDCGERLVSVLISQRLYTNVALNGDPADERLSPHGAAKLADAILAALAAAPAPTQRDFEFFFSCPNCGDPAATTVENVVDIHSGAVHTCAECGGHVVWEAKGYPAITAPSSKKVSK